MCIYKGVLSSSQFIMSSQPWSEDAINSMPPPLITFDLVFIHKSQLIQVLNFITSRWIFETESVFM